jgi:hypothetical protein
VLNRRQIRWSKTLLIYNFKIFYKKESDNVKADALNRRADHAQNIKPQPQSILKISPEDLLIYNYIMITIIFTIFNQD